MRLTFVATALLISAASALPAIAQYNGRDAMRTYTRQGDFQPRERSPLNWHEYRNYDWNRPEPGQTAYYADRYYRPGTRYRLRTLEAGDRVYADSDGRYYCRRANGTTGLIVSGVSDRISNVDLRPGDSRLTGSLTRVC